MSSKSHKDQLGISWHKLICKLQVLVSYTKSNSEKVDINNAHVRRTSKLHKDQPKMAHVK